MVKHSPLPWRVEDYGHRGFDIVFGDDEDSALNMHGFIYEPNARFIVRACNHHDEMREFIEYIKDNTVDDEFGAEELLAKLEAVDE